MTNRRAAVPAEVGLRPGFSVAAELESDVARNGSRVRKDLFDLRRACAIQSFETFQRKAT